MCRTNPEKTPNFSLNVNSSVSIISINTDNMSLSVILITSPHTWTHTIFIYWHTDTCVRKVRAGSDFLTSESFAPRAFLSLFPVIILCPLFHHCPPMSCSLGPLPSASQMYAFHVRVQWAIVCCSIKSHQSGEKGKFFPLSLSFLTGSTLFTWYQGRYED